MRWVLSLLLLSFLFGETSPASAKLVIEVNKSTQTLTVIRDGRAIFSWPVSTGKSGHGTPSGKFTAFRMEADHFSKEWDDAPMPHSVFFTKQGHAIHGTFDVKRLGSPVSHGCVRLAPENAARLFDLVAQEGLPNTQVILSGNEQVAIQRSDATRAKGRSRGDQHVSSGKARLPEPYEQQDENSVERSQHLRMSPRSIRANPNGAYYYFDPYDGKLRSLPRRD